MTTRHFVPMVMILITIQGWLDTAFLKTTLSPSWSIGMVLVIVHVFELKLFITIQCRPYVHKALNHLRYAGQLSDLPFSK